MPNTNANLIVAGQPAPDFTLRSHTDQPVQLSSFQGKQNVVLFFMRTFTCAHCTYYVRQLAAHYADIKAQDAEVLILGIGDTREAQGLVRRLNTPFPVLNDPDGVTYEHFTLNRVLLSLVQPAATFVIDRQGMIRYSHRSTNPLEWLKISALTDTLAALNITTAVSLTPSFPLSTS
ncbi:MAG: peroxiredoxin family protein [Aggregatilineales bacterium]